MQQARFVKHMHRVLKGNLLVWPGVPEQRHRRLDRLVVKEVAGALHRRQELSQRVSHHPFLARANRLDLPALPGIEPDVGGPVGEAHHATVARLAEMFLVDRH